MAANQEIERKFLLRVPPAWLGECVSEAIAQGYVALEEATEVRLRRRGEQRLLTVKRGSGESREEREIELGEDDFERLWPLTEGRRVSKRRYVREADEGSLEIDVYEGELDGLMTAEMEFASEAEADAFQPPAWLGEELTGDVRWANRSLAVEGRPASP
jgi:CYTH domain-containing protein